ncbi:MAG: hypothetical protein KF860_12155 [Cyclobacteriaceae bacterium]|nr:hypothetical protein [Cyclobacteriaceae bacterium]
MIASLGFFDSNLVLLHQAAYQSYVTMADTSELTVLHFSEEEFERLNWTEKGREFQWQEKMFDISSIEKNDDGYRVTCKHDVVESFVVKALTPLKNGGSNNLPVKKRSRKGFSTKHFAQKILKIAPVETHCKMIRFEPIQKPSQAFNEIISPPPEFFLFS